MDATGTRSFRAVLAGCALTALVGAGVALRGVMTPIYSVSVAEAGKLHAQWCTENGQVDHAAGDRYQALFTDHYAWKDTGVGLMLGAATLAILAIALRRTAAERPWLRSPSWRWLFPLLGLVVVAQAGFVLVQGFVIDAYRLYLPACADSWGIPVTASIGAMLVVIPVLLLTGMMLTLLFGNLPVRLDQWDKARPVRSWAATIVFSSLMLLVSAIGIASLPTDTSAWSVAAVLAVYLLAATRAALLAPRERVRDELAAAALPAAAGG